jgi:type II secretory pathway pseudopilin PulG
MKPRATHGAFTLLELLVAVTITLIIAALMLSVTSGMLQLWRRTQAASTQANSAKQVFDLLEQDFQAALYRRDANRWLAVDVIDAPAGLANHGWLVGPGIFKPANGGSLRLLSPAAGTGAPQLAQARFGLSGAWLRFFSTHIEAEGSLPAAIAYQIARRPVWGVPEPGNPAPVRYSLYRSAVSPAQTFANGYDITAAAYASTTNTPPAASNAFRQAGNVMNPSQANLLASNVVDFGCWFHRRDAAGGLQRIFPSGTSDLAHHAIGSSAVADSRFPEVVDVMLRILTEEGATQLEAIEAGRISARPSAFATDSEWWWAVVEANSKVFTRRIEIKGTPP